MRPTLLTLMARVAHDRGVIAEAHKRAERWLHDRRAIAPDMVGGVLSMATLSDDPKLFDHMLAEARRVSDRRERSLLLEVLGGFRAPALHDRALAFVVGSEFDQREAIGILYHSLFNRETREPTWVWLQQQFDGIVVKMREDDAMHLFGRVPLAFCDEQHRSAAATFLAPRAKSHSGAPHELDDALESVKTCSTAWNRNKDAIAAFLSKY